MNEHLFPGHPDFGLLQLVIAQSQHQYQAHSDHVFELRATHDNQLRQLQAKHDAHVQQLKSEHNKETQRLQNEVVAAAKKVELVQEAADEARRERDAAQQATTAAQQATNAARQALKLAQQSLKTAQEDINAAQQAANAAQQAKNAATKALKTAKQEIQEVEKAAVLRAETHAKGIRSELNQTVARLQEQYKNAQAKWERLHKEQLLELSKAKNLRKQVDALQKQNSKLQVEQQRLHVSISGQKALAKKASVLQRKLDRTRDDLAAECVRRIELQKQFKQTRLYTRMVEDRLREVMSAAQQVSMLSSARLPPKATPDLAEKPVVVTLPQLPSINAAMRRARLIHLTASSLVYLYTVMQMVMTLPAAVAVRLWLTEQATSIQLQALFEAVSADPFVCGEDHIEDTDRKLIALSASKSMQVYVKNVNEAREEQKRAAKENQTKDSSTDDDKSGYDNDIHAVMLFQNVVSARAQLLCNPCFSQASAAVLTASGALAEALGPAPGPHRKELVRVAKNFSEFVQKQMLKCGGVELSDVMKGPRSVFVSYVIRLTQNKLL